MPRCTLIVGNGLGRSIDNDYFQLNAGLAHVWNNRETISQEQKNLVISAIDGLTQQRYPENEDQLDKLQVAIIAAGFLRSFENEDVEWLNDHSRTLPAAFSKYIHEVAQYFHCSGYELENEFVDPLAEFIRETSSHVGVLNYDNLLYDSFVNVGLLNGYHDTLIDGFRAAGFDGEYMDRNRVQRQAWFMHLHGSPLYVGNRKLMREERDRILPDSNCHIVLTHVRHKPLIIINSRILSEYWRRLGKALDESQKVILFGYSGCDNHLNDLVASKFKDKSVCIIERDNDTPLADIERYWINKIPGSEIEIHRIDNILNFTDWRGL